MLPASDHLVNCPPDTLAAAMDYIAAGVSIIPIRRDGTKAPDGRLLPKGLWSPFQHHIVDVATARRWWERPDPPGIGTVGGAVSGNLEQLDFDQHAALVFPRWAGL